MQSSTSEEINSVPDGVPPQPTANHEDDPAPVKVVPATLSWWFQLILIILTLTSGASTVIQTAITVVMTAQTGNLHFSNFFKFSTACVLCLLLTLHDVSGTWQSMKKSRFLLANNVKADQDTSPEVINEVPLLKQHPWFFLYFTGFFRALGLSLLVFASQTTSYSLAFSFFVAGQLTISILLDHFGLFSTPVRLFNWWKLAGCVFLLGGVVWVASSLSKSSVSSVSQARSIGYFILAGVLAFFAGILMPLSSAMNRTVARYIDSYSLAIAVTFLIGSIFLALVWMVSTFMGIGTTYDALTSGQYWYFWLAAPIVLYQIVLSTVLPPLIGAAFFNSVLIFAMLATSICFDQFRILSTKPPYAISVGIIAGMVFIFVGVVLSRCEFTCMCCSCCGDKDKVDTEEEEQKLVLDNPYDHSTGNDPKSSPV